MDDDVTFENPGKKVKKKNFFDEDVPNSSQAALTIRKASSDDDDEEEEEITFDGKPVIRYTNKTNSQASKAPMPDLTALAVPALSPVSRTVSNPASSSYAHPPAHSSTFNSTKNAMGFGHTRSHSLTFGAPSGVEPRGLTPKPQFVPSHMSSTTSLSEMDDTNAGSLTSLSSRKQMSASDVDKMQQEIQRLRRSLLGAKRDRWVKLPIDDTLKRIAKGENYSLELYKSLEDKLELLDKAVNLHDGNAITAAVLFLKDTVTSAIFKRELLQRNEAADHYLSYLKAHYDHFEYISVLMMLGRTEEAAIFKFRMALSTADIPGKISKLNECLRSNLNSDPHLAQDASLVKEYVDLLERQRPIDAQDANDEAAGKTPIFRDIPRKVSLVGHSVISTLYYCCLYHYHLTENSFASPQAIKKRHQISDKQFLWTAISARAKVRSWKDIEALMTTKGWFGGTKMKSLIGFDKVVAIVQRYSAPPEVLEKYLMLIDDIDQRLELAKTVGCQKVIVDTYVATKNRPALEKYVTQFDRNSTEGLYAQYVLSSSTIRWK